MKAIVRDKYCSPDALELKDARWRGCAVSGECQTTLEAYLSASAHGEAHRVR